MSKKAKAQKAEAPKPEAILIPLWVSKDIGLRELARICFELGVQLEFGFRKLPRKRCLRSRRKERKR
jgi:hypothetical protein